ncbi:MAG: hypothetical protein ACK55I_16145, partial [bacterium]
ICSQLKRPSGSGLLDLSRAIARSGLVASSSQEERGEVRDILGGQQRGHHRHGRHPIARTLLDARLRYRHALAGRQAQRDTQAALLQQHPGIRLAVIRTHHMSLEAFRDHGTRVDDRLHDMLERRPVSD